MKVDLLNTTQRVREYLAKKPKLRDDDNLLISHIWDDETNEVYKAGHLTKLDFLFKYLGEGKLTSSESIRRVRQKLQELHPELRGNLYEKRQKNQLKIKNQLKDINKMTTIEFKEKLNNHDWFFMMSEDESVYKRGLYAQQQLSQLADTKPEWKKLYKAKQKEINAKLV